MMLDDASRLRRALCGAVCLGALVLTGCGLGALDDFAPLTPTDNFHVIEPGRAYRSAQLDATSIRLASDVLGIRTIVNLRGENEQDLWYQRERAVTEDLGVTLVDVRMSASALPPREELLRLYDAFVSAEYPILLHCKSGADRTGAVAAIWRMVVLGEPYELAVWQLSPLLGHFEFVHPEMDRLVRMFQPSREWIEQEYPID
ncbi:MAG: tyrosine-protein phosphatase [Planctomycetes bacterium]|nr:tyrosine-protein phosphatase [Planctomycetota bacterium]